MNADRGAGPGATVKPTPVKAGRVVLSPAMSAGEAFSRILQAAIAHMEANESGVLAGNNPESLHQMRVALRRMRSAFTLFADACPAGVAAEAKWLSDRLARSRDWDVFVFETLPCASESLPGMAGMDEIRRRSDRLREAAARDARRAVASPRYRALTKRLQCVAHAAGSRAGRKLDSDIRRHAVRVLEERHAKVLKRGEALRNGSWRELHALRIAIKKLRYAVEFFHSLFDARRTRTLRSRLTALQDLLGAANDSVTARRLLARGFDASDPRLAPAIGMIAGWTEGRALAQREALRGAWKAFRRAKVFWK